MTAAYDYLTARTRPATFPRSARLSNWRLAQRGVGRQGAVEIGLVMPVAGQTPIGDKNYFGRGFEQQLAELTRAQIEADKRAAKVVGKVRLAWGGVPAGGYRAPHHQRHHRVGPALGPVGQPGVRRSRA